MSTGRELRTIASNAGEDSVVVLGDGKVAATADAARRSGWWLR